MAIAKITSSGLKSIGILVVILWACILGERLIVQRANQECTQALTKIRVLRMKKRAEPVSAPARPWKPSLPRPEVG